MGTLSDRQLLVDPSSERKRFKEPPQVFEGSRSDIVRLRIAGELRVLQEVDIESSVEIALDAGLRQLSAHRKNRCVLFEQSVGSRERQFEPCAGLGRDNFRDSLGDSGVPATRSLAYT
jgi:hypothetical protein